MMKAEGHKQIPVPYKEYNYVITNFQGSFLQMMVPYEELQAFLSEVSQKMRQTTQLRYCLFGWPFWCRVAY